MAITSAVPARTAHIRIAVGSGLSGSDDGILFSVPWSGYATVSPPTVRQPSLHVLRFLPGPSVAGRQDVDSRELSFTCRAAIFYVQRDDLTWDEPALRFHGLPIMGNTKAHSEIALVRRCLAGSEAAWNEFYNRYVGLVRSIVSRQRVCAGRDCEDVVQSVFASLIPALKNYDPDYSLPRFICLVAERTCIQEYRLTKAAKRDANTLPVDHHDSGEEGARILRSPDPSPEQNLIRHDLQERLRRALRALGGACRELLKLRYFEQLSYKEIAQRLGASENTLAVRSKRCLSQLSSDYGEPGRRGFDQ